MSNCRTTTQLLLLCLMENVRTKYWNNRMQKSRVKYIHYSFVCILQNDSKASFKFTLENVYMIMNHNSLVNSSDLAIAKKKNSLLHQ